MFLRDFEKTAFIFRDEEISYADLLRNVDLYTRLIEIEKDDKVAIVAENRPEWLYIFFAVWKSGGTCVMIDYLSSSDELAYIFSDCKPKYIFSSTASNKNVEDAKLNIEDYAPKTYNFDELTEEDFSGEIKNNHITESDIASLIYTSGTTGKPKGVMLTFANFMFEVTNIIPLKITEKEDRVLLLLPFHHAYPILATVLEPLYLGSTLIFVEKLTSEEILGTMEKYKPTILLVVPRIMTMFHKSIMRKINSNNATKAIFALSRKTGNLKLGRILFNKVHKTFGGCVSLIICGGAKLDIDLAKDFWAMGFKMSEGYGLTETAPIICFNSKNKIKIGSVGKPLPNIEVKINDGEIITRGGNVMKGYYKNDEATALVLKNGWFHTGDTGTIDKEGYVYVTGRKKDIIVLQNGKNINPEEIENSISNISELIKEIAVYEKDGQLNTVIFPDFEFVKKTGIINLEETIKWNVIDKYNLTAKHYAKISGIVISKKELPKTRLGKVKRFELKDFITVKDEKSDHLPDPDFEEYFILKDFVEKLTDRPIFADSHIEIDLGLDSLDKVELQYFIENSFGVKVEPSDISNNSEMSSLAKYLSEVKTKSENGEVDWKEVLNEDTAEIDYGKSHFLSQILKVMFIPLLKYWFKLESGGKENIPDGPFIIASNHQCYIDALFVAAALKNDVLAETYFFGKEKHFNGKIRRNLAKMTNILIMDINKNVKTSLQTLAEVLRNKKNIVVFPEGARTRTGKIMNFKKSYAILAKETQVPIVPFVIKGAYEVYPPEKKLPGKGRIRVKFLKPIYPGNMSYEQINDLVVQRIRKEFDRMKV